MTEQDRTMSAEAPPPAAVLMQMLFGPTVQQSIYVATELGIADLLAENPQTAAELASRTEAHAPSLYRVLRLLASVGIFAERRDGKFELTPIAALLRSDLPGSMRDITRMMGGEWHWRMYGELMHSVRTGGTAIAKAYRMELFDLLAEDAQAGELFNRAMTSNSWAAVPAVVQAYDFSGFRKVLDVGGGHGILLAGILKANPRLRGVLFDLPSVLEGAGALLAQEGVSDRAELIAGDFFRSVPAGADAYLLKHIIHDWDDERSVEILRNVRSAMDEDGRVHIVEMVVPEGNEPSASKLLDIQMLMGTGGRERTEAEYRALLEASGFRLTRITPTISPLGVIEGEPA